MTPVVNPVLLENWSARGAFPVVSCLSTREKVLFIYSFVPFLIFVFRLVTQVYIFFATSSALVQATFSMASFTDWKSRMIFLFVYK